MERRNKTKTSRTVFHLHQQFLDRTALEEIVVPLHTSVLVNSRKRVSYQLGTARRPQGAASVCYGRTQVSTKPAEFRVLILETIARALITKN